MLEDLAERWPFSLPLTTAGAIVAITLAGVAWQTWQWQSALRQGAVVAHGSELDREPENTLPMILGADLFGEATRQPPASAGALPMTPSAGFTLRAAIAGSRAGAVIEGADGQARWFPLNAAVAAGVRLHQVHVDHVVLERGGRLETLAFPAPAELASNAVSATESGIGGESMTSPAAGTPAKATPIPANASPEDKARIVHERLEELRNRSRS
ncbi:MAG: hypothetical protein IPJ33_11875 [Gammaproteobacteria bacterium]|jgi:general secretion pathway protein C|nr:hypothetical protein [Gammaproteobacteria bacterium]MBP6052842.1 hypothetical protein [Pseudomonadales bacterium]MBK6582347.1 hypothetical protein [Gammaproteobacteria bacterium]MBK7171455.1 hypothetical protein [Gammaproteobacteria bacterium]MBK7521381.1 hypothetical protein [Gammaproteobacteria bacterium]